MSEVTYQFATRALGMGHLDQADGLFRSIPSSAPEYPDAVTGLAVIAYQRGRAQEAVGHFSMLVALRPGEAANHCNLGECLRECGRFDEAEAQLKLGIKIDPDQPDAFNSLGLIYHAQKRLDLAEDAIRTAIRLRPSFAMAMINLGMVLQEKRRLKEAAELFRCALEIEPDNPMGNSNLGQILVEIGKIDDLDEAEACCLKAIALTPNRPHPINNLGNVYRSMGRFEEALECYERALKVAPELAMPLNNTAQALQGRARYAEATDYYLNALAKEPNSPRFHANYASLLNDQDLHEDAIARYRHALAIDADHAESYCGMAHAYLEIEKSDEAEASFRKCLELDPELIAPRLGLTNLYSEMGDFEKADIEAKIALNANPKLVEVYSHYANRREGGVTEGELSAMTAMVDEKYLGDGARSQLHFALGVVHDKRKDYRAAGRFFQTANELQASARSKRSEHYHPDQFSKWIESVIAGFSPEFMASRQGQGHASQRPIFVVGLPRSGTTLTEQILASHSSVHGAGELTFLNKTFENLPNVMALGGIDSFAALKSVDPATLRTSAGAYLAEIARKNAISSHVVDKMPDNIHMLGWIRTIFPNAKIIHCQRDLRDIALSCFQTSFGSIRWANDWATIAGRFAEYLRVVEHWKAIDSIDWLDFPYESVTADTEGHARRLIEFVGLDWEPDCLKFHETKRQVRTASLSQVREPIYRTSVAKWKRYESEMAPFLDEMARRGVTFPPSPDQD